MEDLRAMELCAARKRSGGRCRRPAGHGTEHLGIGRCSLHGGSTPAQMERARRDLALREVAVMGARLEIEPTQALLECVYRAAGHAGKVESLSEDEVLCVGAHGRPTPHTWIRLEQEALDRLARFSKMALDAGVAERQIKIAERTGARIAAALEEAVAPLGLSAGERSAMVQRFVQGLTVLEHTDDDA
jgi:hypothetical protein